MFKGSILWCTVIACFLAIPARVSGQDAPLLVAPTGTLVVFGWSEDQTLQVLANLRADGFLFRGLVEGDGHHNHPEAGMSLARCSPCFSGDRIGVSGRMFLWRADRIHGDPTLRVGDVIGVWAHSAYEDYLASQMVVIPSGGVVTLPGVPPGKDKRRRHVVLTVPVHLRFEMEVRPSQQWDSPVTYVVASSLATVTVAFEAVWEGGSGVWEYYVDAAAPFRYVLGPTFSARTGKAIQPEKMKPGRY